MAGCQAPGDIPLPFSKMTDCGIHTNLWKIYSKCKRSARSLNESGSRESAAVRDDGFEKKLERIPSLKDARSLGGQQSGSEELAVVGLIAEADLSPLDGRTSAPLRGVVGGLNSFKLEKGEQTVPMLEEALCDLAHITVGAGSVLLEALAHSASDGDRSAYKGLPVQMSVLEGVPEGKHSAGLRKHPF